MVLVNLPVCCKEMDMLLLVEFPAALDVSSVQLIGMSCRSRLRERGMWVQAVVMMLFWFLWCVSFFLQKNKATKHRPFGGTKMSPNFETPPSFMDYFCIFAIGMLSLLATVTHFFFSSQHLAVPVSYCYNSDTLTWRFTKGSSTEILEGSIPNYIHVTQPPRSPRSSCRSSWKSKGCPPQCY